MFHHPLDPFGAFMHHMEDRIRNIEELLNINESNFRKEHNLEKSNISVKEIEELIEKQKHVEYNKEWNSIVKSIKNGALESNTPIEIQFWGIKHKAKMRTALKEIGFLTKRKNAHMDEKNALAYIVTIKKS